VNTINTFVANTYPILNEMILSTEYVSPDEGFAHPSAEDFYGFDVTMTDINGNTVKSSRYMKIRGGKLLFFRVSHVIRNPQMDNLYTITFSTDATYPVA